MTFRAVLFDFSGTLFRLEHESFAEHADLIRAITAPSAVAAELDASLGDAWERRDLDPQLHRTAYLAALRGRGVADPEAIYGHMLDPQCWQPYPDTVATLAALAGVPVAVVSNIAWDISPVLARHGVDRYVDEVVLSFEEGVMKPDPKIFRVACDRLGVEPAEALMVGDSAAADGGATAIGCGFELVAPLPTAERPAALQRIVRLLEAS